ncbi:MAG: helix-turn-helix domain-containing protein [Thermoguttaceae bacterium]|jgi:predicted DNA-binding transcriptional regulator AlpA
MTATVSSEDFLPTRDAAPYCGLRPQTLCAWRSAGRGGPAYLKLGRKVVYRKSDLDAWLASRRRTHTGQEG